MTLQLSQICICEDYFLAFLWLGRSKKLALLNFYIYFQYLSLYMWYVRDNSIFLMTAFSNSKVQDLLDNTQFYFLTIFFVSISTVFECFEN